MMCGRYTITVTMEQLLAYFLLEQQHAPFHTPRYNVAPSQMVPAVIHDGEQHRIGQLRWGLIPQWAKDASFANKTINARAETVHEKPSFKIPFERKRCLIPADSFYEWLTIDGTKQPMRIMLKSEGLFCMAGLYDTWLSPEGEKISTCTIITTNANELVRDIHERMPVILSPEAEKAWLDPAQSTVNLQALLTPFPAEQMQAYPVSPIVGNVKNDMPQCIEPIELP